jgi:phosphodiesterase/alkaline phosphatase D-like protein
MNFIINKLLFSLLLVVSINFAQNIEITNSIVVGGVTSNSARFWIRTSVPSQVNIEISEDNLFTNNILGEEISTTEEKGNAGIVEVDGLNASTKYYYRAISGNTIIDNLERSFWSFPESGTQSNFSFAFGSCQQSGAFLPSQTEEISVFDEILKHDARFFLQLGDWGYPDTTDFTPIDNNYFAANYNLVQKSYWSKFNKDYPMDNLLRTMPVDYVYDDHDYMNNNSSALTSSFYIPYKPNDSSDNFVTMEIDNPTGARQNSIRGYKENMPSYPLENESRGIYHKFLYGNVEIFALDLRAQKSSALEIFRFDEVKNTWLFDPPQGHSIIGRDNAIGQGESQLKWFLNGLKNSTADWKFIMSSVPFNIGQFRALSTGLDWQNIVIPIEGAPEGSTAIAASFELADGWSGFPKDTEEILNFITDNNIENVIVLSGDSHNAAIDDGTNAGLPEIMAGNLDITNSRSITLFESFGINIWNKGGHGISTNEFNDAFGKVTVYGSDSVKLSLIDEFGILFADHTVLNTKVTSIVDNNLIPEFQLKQNYPNPFNPTTNIKYSVPPVEKGYIPSLQLIVYDILGREVATLVNEKQKPGYYEVDWNASELTSGIYFYRLKVGNFLETKKMILLK